MKRGSHLAGHHRRWPWFLGLFASFVFAAVGLVYHDPLWIVDHTVDFYLRHHGVRHHMVNLRGEQIHYLEAKPSGDGPDRPLLLIHGLGARATDWAPMIPSLAAHGYHVYAIDLLGYGESAKPADGDFSLRGEERVVVAFLKAEGISQADVAGWSMGGWVAMLTALDHPEVVHRLLLYDSAGLYFRVDFPLTLFSPDNRAGLEALIARIEPDTPRIRIPAFAVHGMVRRFRASRWIVERSLASMLAGPNIVDFRIVRLRMPVLIVWGTEDKLTPFALGQRLHELLPQSVLVGATGCGHLAAAECSKQVLPTTLRFLDAQPPLPASAILIDGHPGAPAH